MNRVKHAAWALYLAIYLGTHTIGTACTQNVMYYTLYFMFEAKIACNCYSWETIITYLLKRPLARLCVPNSYNYKRQLCSVTAC